MWRCLLITALIGLPGLILVADGQSTPAVIFEVVDKMTGQPVAEANVTVLCLSDLDHPVSLKTGSDGRTRYMDASKQNSKRLRVTVRASGYHPYHAAIDDAKASSHVLPIQLRPGKVLRGRVVDSSGKPIAGVRVTTTDAADVSAHGYFYTLFDTQTDAAGRFEFDSVASAKELRCQFSHPEYRTQWGAGIDDGEMEVVLAQERHVQGKVSNYRGEPVTDAIVMAEQGDGPANTAEDGTFDLGMVSGSPIQIVVTADRLSPQLMTRRAGIDSSNLSVRLLPGRTVRFRVTDEDKSHVSGVQVVSLLWQNTSSLRIKGTTDDDGQLIIRNAPADDVQYEFRHPDFAVHTANLKAETNWHEIQLHPMQPLASVDTYPTDIALDVDRSVSTRRIMHLCKIDGTVLRPLINDVALRNQYDLQGSPDVSPDGSTIAYDARPAGGAKWDEGRIVVAKIDGTNARDVGWGAMPSLSPNGSHIAYSRPRKHAPQDGARGQSIWTMKADGTDQKMIADYYAWGAHWTADGRSIVFRGGADDQGNYVPGNCLRIYDLQTETIRNVFPPTESPFSSLHFHLNVSRHGRLAVMKGTLRDGNEGFAVIDIDRGLESIQLVKHRFPDFHHLYAPIAGSVSFSADNNWIVNVCQMDGRRVGCGLHIDGIREPRVFPNLPQDLQAIEPAYTPDGKHLIVGIGQP